jgi:HAD superfamily 5'-nucleotidase-like hydrolase
MQQQYETVVIPGNADSPSTELFVPREDHPVMRQMFRQFVEETNALTEVEAVPAANPLDVFVNYEMRWKDIKVIGCDYDYTLANYSDAVQPLIYRLALAQLVEKGYPAELSKKEYDPSFAIRGLHYDMERGCLLKLNFLHHIKQCMFGRMAVEEGDLLEYYLNSHTLRKHPNLRLMLDLYALAEICLISDVIQFFVDRKIKFNAASIYGDVASAVSAIHERELLHQEILADLPQYLQPNPKSVELLQKLKSSGKKLFLLTNSAYPYVNAGMKRMCEGTNVEDWKRLFDVIITLANKPSFYTSRHPFRCVDMKTNRFLWDTVNTFKPGKVYAQGNMEDLGNITGWESSSILYFGDHLASDIVEPNLHLGWRTGLIIRELEREVDVQNSAGYRRTLSRLLDLDKLIRETQRRPHDPVVLAQWRQQINIYREHLKNSFNKYFGSTFRTYNNETYFAYTLRRYADLYTSRFENLLYLPLHDPNTDYIFYPFRAFLPHEARIVRSWTFKDEPSSSFRSRNSKGGTR